MSVLDIIVIAVLGVFAIIGLIKGFLNTLLSLFGNLASLAVAIVIAKPCAQFFNRLFGLVNWLGGLIIKAISGILPTTLETGTMTPAEVITHLKSQGIIGNLTSLFVNQDVELYGAGATSLTDTLTATMGGFATTVFTAIIMFILIRIAVVLLSKLFNAITSKKAIGWIDRLLGTILGLLKGGLVITGVLSIIYALSPLIPVFDEWITASSFTNWIYGYVNQLINWVISSINWQSFGIG